MKHILTILLILSSIISFAQLKPIAPKVSGGTVKFNQYADTIDVYIAVKDGIFTTNEIYDLWRGKNGENPMLTLCQIGINTTANIDVNKVLQSKIENKFTINNFQLLTPIAGIFPTLVSGGYTTIWYKVPVKSFTNTPSVLAAYINEIIVRNMQIKIEPYYNTSCSGKLGNNGNLGIGYSNDCAYKLFSKANSGCDYINEYAINKSIRFVINKIENGK